jgi:AbrB family looped-hinge helix DNA binding protein
MKRRVRLTSKGQVTIPAVVRRALDLREGDQVVFELGQQPGDKVARLRRASDIFAMAGTIPPHRALPDTWAEERRLAREEAARRRR